MWETLVFPILGRLPWKGGKGSGNLQITFQELQGSLGSVFGDAVYFGAVVRKRVKGREVCVGFPDLANKTIQDGQLSLHVR